MLRVFIGYDSREPLAFHVLAHSIQVRASRPVSVTPLMLSQLADVYHRPRGPESTEFSYTRFLVPYLCAYSGPAVYLDCDMLCQADLIELVDYFLYPGGQPTPRAVFVCPHDYTPSTTHKFLGQSQTAYPRKNWSSLMLFRADRCQALTPEYVNTAPGADLHRFAWCRDEDIGFLPLGWNHLVGEYPANPAACLYHFTLGGPWFPEYADCDHADRWWAERKAMGA